MTARERIFAQEESEARPGEPETLAPVTGGPTEIQRHLWPSYGSLFTNNRAILLKVGLILLVVGLGIAGFFAARQWSLAGRPPEEIALAYARAVYARDYAQAWEFISAADKQYKTREQYLAENGSFSGLQQELAATLAGWIQFTEPNVEVVGDRATVTVHVKAPNGNQPEVYQILREAEGESELTAGERRALFERLERMDAAGQIEIIEGDHIFTLRREPGGWRVVVDWAGAIVVKFTAEVSPDLDWEFYPLQAEVRALPGETLSATYRAVNRSDRSITAKGKHIVLPEEYKDYFTTLQCFCFVQQTLQPGESKDMQLVFRIDYDVPAEVREFENKYVFYPIESFPED